METPSPAARTPPQKAASTAVRRLLEADAPGGDGDTRRRRFDPRCTKEENNAENGRRNAVPEGLRCLAGTAPASRDGEIPTAPGGAIAARIKLRRAN
jgi:hypothetical protein